MLLIILDLFILYAFLLYVFTLFLSLVSSLSAYLVFSSCLFLDFFSLFITIYYFIFLFSTLYWYLFIKYVDFYVNEFNVVNVQFSYLVVLLLFN